MKLYNTIYCNLDVFSLFITEELLLKLNCPVSITDYNNEVEYMIFFGKKDNSSYFEITVYKDKPIDKYIHKKSDNILEYIETDKYVYFIFKNFSYAYNFLCNFFYNHPELIQRPIHTIK